MNKLLKFAQTCNVKYQFKKFRTDILSLSAKSVLVSSRSINNLNSKICLGKTNLLYTACFGIVENPRAVIGV